MTMQEFARSFLCAVLAVALALVVLTFGAPAHAQLGDLRYPDHAQLGEHDANVVESVRTVTIAVRVAKADGSPAAGAVVVSAAGGQGVTNAEGVAHLDVTLSSEADSVHVTAAATESGATSTGSVRVAIDADQIDAGVITLAEGGECAPEWVPSFGGDPGVSGAVNALAVFDDGSGPALYAGGVFLTAGSVSASRIAKWDGATWSPLGSGVTGGGFQAVRALTVFDDGSGPALYAGGELTAVGGVLANRIAKWDGANWSPLGSGITGGSSPSVNALTVFDDGSGPALYAAGSFTTAGGVLASRIAKWNGASWSPLGSGVTNTVNALTVYDDGSGSALYAGGTFTTAGGVLASRIAKWNGASWSSLGSGVTNTVNALTVFDDGSGAALYAGGNFTTAGGVSASRLAKWDPDTSGWSPLGSGVSSTVNTLTVFDDGSGPALYAGGAFFTAGGVGAIGAAKWDGASWAPLGSGMGGSSPVVNALTIFDDGSGPVLFAGGSFTIADGMGANRITKWDGASWSPLGNGISGAVNVLTVYDDGSGPALYVGGDFTSAADVVVNSIAKWNPDTSGWAPLGSGVNGTVHALTVFDDGAGPVLYAAGNFSTAGGVSASNIARWDPDTSGWSPLGSGLASGAFPSVRALMVFDDGSGPALYAGGSFTTASGAPASRIAKWDPDTSGWLPLGSGVIGAVNALAVYNDGSGLALYAAGEFNFAGGAPASFIAKWDGASWSPLGSGVASTANALTVFDDGSGPSLYAGGSFTIAGGVLASGVAKWDPDTSGWSPLGSGLTVGGSSPTVRALVVFDDGSGPALYAGGNFTIAGGLIANRIAKWDGATWAPLGSGINNNSVSTLSVFDDISGPALYAGGAFTTSSADDSFLAKWQGCFTQSTPADINGDGEVNGTDLAALLVNWGPCAKDVSCPADLNGDGEVNGADLAALLASWGVVE